MPPVTPSATLAMDIHSFTPREGPQRRSAAGPKLATTADTSRLIASGLARSARTMARSRSTHASTSSLTTT